MISYCVNAVLFNSERHQKSSRSDEPLREQGPLPSVQRGGLGGRVSAVMVRINAAEHPCSGSCGLYSARSKVSHCTLQALKELDLTPAL